ncbi:MAG: aldo/keto reductase, partial [Oscillospiraceae bacterium]|nr:aldo/keto reductase [Oscillospiraceae bacterium]
MQYRNFGKTGKKISALGFGCMRLPEFEKDGKWYIDDEKAVPMLKKAYENGVNYFDTAHGYCNGNSQYTLGKAIKSMKREDIMVATKIPLWDVKENADFRKFLDEQLRRLDTPYIDFYHFHGLNKGEFDNKVAKFGLIDEAKKALNEGLIKNMSFSFHGDPKDMQYLVEQGEIFSSVLLQYNLLDRSNEEAIAYLAGKGLGVVAMGPVAGGRLAAPSTKLSEGILENKESMATYELALRFVLGNPNVSCALSGMTTMETVEQNLKSANIENPMTEKDFENARAAMEEMKKLSDLYCTGCDYCMPCPQGIKIPHIFNAYTYHNVYGLTGHAKNMYGEIGKKDHAGKPVSECTECGECESKCPQKIKITEKLKETD